MEGIIIVDKPTGWTSFDVVAKIRALTKIPKVGHSGTLDPMATGVLPIFLGRATKAIDNFLKGDKGYDGEMVLGVKTDTGDADGQVKTSNINFQISNEGIKKIFEKYTGQIMQTPPMYSAVKVNGQRLYKLARQGIEVKREPRRVTIYSLELLDQERQPENQIVRFSVLCSKGTYIRQLAVDIGDEIGCGAHVKNLRRTYAQPFHLSQALPMETVVTLAKIGRLSSVILPVESFL